MFCPALKTNLETYVENGKRSTEVNAAFTTPDAIAKLWLFTTEMANLLTWLHGESEGEKKRKDISLIAARDGEIALWKSLMAQLLKQVLSSQALSSNKQLSDHAADINK